MEQSTFFIFATLGLITLGSLVVYLCVYHKCKIWSEKNKVHKSKYEQQLIFTKKILEVQEAERERIAKDLHDDLGALAIKLKLINKELGKKGTTEKKLLEIKANNEFLANEIIRTGRAVAHDLMPRTLEKEGFVEAIKELVDEFSHSDKFSVKFENTFDFIEFDKTAQISIYRVLKEWFNNVLNHSQASEMKLVIHREKGELLIDLRDNGQPFSLELAKTYSNGFGLMNIEGRLNQLNARYSFINHKGSGNSFKIFFPLK